MVTSTLSPSTKSWPASHVAAVTAVLLRLAAKVPSPVAVPATVHIRTSPTAKAGFVANVTAVTSANALYGMVTLAVPPPSSPPAVVTSMLSPTTKAWLVHVAAVTATPFSLAAKVPSPTTVPAVVHTRASPTAKWTPAPRLNVVAVKSEALVSGK